MNAPLSKAEAIVAGDVSALIRALRSELSAGKNNIPADLKAAKSWLVWKVTTINPVTGKFNKIPIYPKSGQNRHGEQGSDADLRNLGTLDDAIQAFENDHHIAGIGFALLGDFGVVALDVDHCVDGDKIREDAAAYTDDTYCEVSPSGTGIRAFWRGSASDGKNHATGFELFHAKGFVTVTGAQINNVFDMVSARRGEALPVLDAGKRVELERLSRAAGTVGKVAGGDRLKDAAERDPRLCAIRSAGLYEREMGGGKHSITCPFEDQHSDTGRPPGDGDTVYFQPNTNAHQEGIIYCTHTHGNDQSKYWEAIGYDVEAEAFGNLDAGDWPIPQPIPDDLPPVPPFDLALLPDALRPWIADIAERMQISPDIPAIGAVTALSAAVGRRMQIMPKAHDDWTVVPNLWGMVVAPPGYMKSPALSEVMKPLHLLEGEAHREYEAARAAWEIQKECTAIANSAAKSTTLAKLKRNPSADIAAPQPEPEEPVATRYCVNNFSLEALGEVLMGNPHGVLAFSDEIHGLLMMAQKPGNEGLNDFLLSAWNGDGSFTFDRIGRGLNRRIDHVCVAVLGGIQPGRLVEHVIGATHGGAGDSGLVQRFQLLTWPDLRAEWQLVDRKPDREAQTAAYQVFEQAVGRSDSGVSDIAGEADSEVAVRRFDPTAQEAFYAWLGKLEQELRGDSLPPVMASHLSKYRSLVPSLALIFAVADNVQGAIPLRYLQQAIGWADYLRPHAERVYACTTRPDTRHARALLSKIKAGAIADDFTSRDVYLKGWSLLDREGVTKAVDLLRDLGYLRSGQKHQQPGGGRPSICYRINPNAKG